MLYSMVMVSREWSRLIHNNLPTAMQEQVLQGSSLCAIAIMNYWSFPTSFYSTSFISQTSTLSSRSGCRTPNLLYKCTTIRFDYCMAAGGKIISWPCIPVKFWALPWIKNRGIFAHALPVFGHGLSSHGGSWLVWKVWLWAWQLNFNQFKGPGWMTLQQIK